MMVGLQEYLEQNSFPITECGCWIWMRSVNDLGYGKIQIKGKTIGAHRASWLAYRGDIPIGSLVCHQCDVPSCINPNHLFLGSHSDNAHDRERKGRGQNLKGQNNNNAKLTDDIVRTIRHSTLPRWKLAKKFGIRSSTVWSIQTQNNVWPHIAWPSPPIDYGKIKTRRNRGKKITAKQAEEIFNSQDRQCVIARRYGISHTLVRYIKSGRVWKPAESAYLAEAGT